MGAKSANVALIEKWFGVEERHREVHRPPEMPEIQAGKIIFLTGPSGAGKSVLMRGMRERWRSERRCGWMDLDSIRLADRAVVDCFGGMRIESVLEVLSRVGLAEAWTYLRRPGELSEGQRWRLRLAKAVAKLKVSGGFGSCRTKAGQEPAPPKNKVGVEPDPPQNKLGQEPDPPEKRAVRVVAADEFCAMLDPVTACVVARMLRRTIDAMPWVCAVVASSREDLESALRPDTIVRCDFDGKVQIVTRDE